MSNLRFLTGISLVLLGGVGVGCGSPIDVDDTGPASTSSDSGSTGPGGSSDPSATSADSGMGSGSDSTTQGEGSSDSGPACPMDGVLGATCTGPCSCESEECFLVGPLGGVCSECDSDEDCAESTGFGCNFGNPLTMTPAACSMDGAIGQGCESAEACADGLLCSTIIDVPMIITAATCSECETDAECSDGQLCAPSYDIANIGGFYRCVDPQSVPDGEGCDLGTSGNEQCMSGNCAPAGLSGIPVVTVCSPCNENSDCPAGGTCQFPELSVDGMMLTLTPGECI